MFHEMRRADRQLSEEETKQLLTKGEYGILSTIGEDGYPYGVPVSYAYKGDKLYFHCANGVGHKLENITLNEKVSFTVVGDTEVLPAKFSTAYESVIVFGTVAPVEDKLEALALLCHKYSPEFAQKGRDYAAHDQGKTGVYAINIEHMTGKSRKNK